MPAKIIFWDIIPKGGDVTGKIPNFLMNTHYGPTE